MKINNKQILGIFLITMSVIIFICNVTLIVMLAVPPMIMGIMFVVGIILMCSTTKEEKKEVSYP